MDHTLVNPNQLREYGMTVQYNPFLESPILIAMEDHDFILPLSSKGNILGVTTKKTTDKELQTCPHITCSSAHDWDPHNFRFPKSSCTVEDNTARDIGAVMREQGPPDLTDTESDSDSVDQIYDIGTMTSRTIGSVKVV